MQIEKVVERQGEKISDMKYEIKDLKRSDLSSVERIKKLEEEVNDLEREQALIKQRLDASIEGTTHTNRLIQQVVFGAVATGIIGGVIALVWAQIGGG